MVGKRKVLKFDKDKILKEIEEKSIKQEKIPKETKSWELISVASELGFSISLPIAAGVILGSVLDAKFDTSPKITLLLLLLGVVLSISNVYLIIRRLFQE